MTEQLPMLEERIEIALQPDAAITSADLAALIEEPETYIAKADEAWTVDLPSSFDPVTPGRARIDATLAANQLRIFLLPKLRARYELVHEQEQTVRRSSAASALAATLMPRYDSRRFSGDWWKENERRAAAQRAEQQRMADYYARMTKEQEDRENAEARERFLAQPQNRHLGRK